MVANGIPQDIVQQYCEQLKEQTRVPEPIPDKVRDASEDKFMSELNTVRKEFDAKMDTMAKNIIAALANELRASQVGHPTIQTPAQTPVQTQVQAPAGQASSDAPLVLNFGETAAVLPPVPAGKLPYAEFFRKAIPQLEAMNEVNPKSKTGEKYAGVHVIYGKNALNPQLMHYYGFTDKKMCRAVTEEMTRQNVIETRFAPGGARVFLPGTSKKNSSIPEIIL